MARTAFLLFSISLITILHCPAQKSVGSNQGEVVIAVTIDAPQQSRDVRLWLPYPVSAEKQKIDSVQISGNYTTQQVYRDKLTGNYALYAEWKKGGNQERNINFTFTAESKERINRNFDSKSSETLPDEIKPFLAETRFIPTSGRIKTISDEITSGKTGIVAKSRAIYDWIVDNTKRDPRVRGCGTGDVERTITEMSGKCADISTVFVALARAAGIPAREVFGLRLGNKPGVSDMTDGHHCWAEFYAPGSGWIPADPSDVLKIALNKGIEIKDAGEYREYYFGAVDANRVVLGRGGRDIYLTPPQKDGPLNYFMYPYAEVDGQALEWLAAQQRLKYKITYTSM